LDYLALDDAEERCCGDGQTSVPVCELPAALAP
jgi:hypothetical protein